jgi:hypothetical protein
VSFKVVLPFLYAYQVDGNGFENVNISAPSLGISYTVYGSETIHTGAVSQLNMVTPATSYDLSSRSVSNAGDVNGDGYDDLIIGVPYAARCYVMFGTEDGFVNMTEGFTIFGAQSSDQTGWSVGGAGDVNNDGFDDIIIGAPYASNGLTSSVGVSYVLIGRRTEFSDIGLDLLTGAQGFRIYGAAAGDCSGLSVSGAGL